MRMLKQTHMMAQALIEGDHNNKKQMDKVQKGLRHLRHTVRDDGKKLNRIEAQRKKKAPQKRQPRPKEDDESGLKKEDFKASGFKGRHHGSERS